MTLKFHYGTLVLMGDARYLIDLLDELARMRGRTASAFGAIRVMHGLTEIENVVLTAVAHAQRPPTVPQIGRSLDHPRQVIQRAADVLAARGLIRWLENPDHKRARLLLPTAAGTKIREQADAAGLELAATLVSNLEPEVLKTTVAGLKTIRAAIEAQLRAQISASDAQHGARG